MLEELKLLEELEEQNLNKFSKDLKKILEITNKHPLELRKIAEIANNKTFNSFEDLFNDYFDSRVPYYIEIHKRYCANLKVEHPVNFYGVLLRLDTNLTTIESINDYDRELILKLEDNSAGGRTTFKYVSLCSAAKKAIEEYYIIQPNISFKKWLNGNERYINRLLESIIENSPEFTNSMRGGALEKLIIWKLGIKRNILLNYYDENTKKPDKIGFRIKKSMYFNTKDLYSKIQDINKFCRGPVLLIPKSPIYSLVDCIIIDPRKSKCMAYLFQITVNIETHEKGDKEILSQMLKNEIDCTHNICEVRLDYNIYTYIRSF